MIIRRMRNRNEISSWETKGFHLFPCYKGRPDEKSCNGRDCGWLLNVDCDLHLVGVVQGVPKKVFLYFPEGGFAAFSGYMSLYISMVRE